MSEKMAAWFLIGGEYTDGTYKTLVPGTEERHGPYISSLVVLKAWREHTRMKTAICFHKLHMKIEIVPISEKEIHRLAEEQTLNDQIAILEQQLSELKTERVRRENVHNTQHWLHYRGVKPEIKAHVNEYKEAWKLKNKKSKK